MPITLSQFVSLMSILMCVHPLLVLVLLGILLYSTASSTVVQYLYPNPMMSRSKLKSSSDIAATAVLLKVLYCKVKNVFSIFCLLFMCYLCEQ